MIVAGETLIDGGVIMARYISAKEVAQMVRKDLKQAFPAVKFGVRSERNAVRIT